MFVIRRLLKMKFSIDECKNICQYIENSLEILQDIVVDSPIERAIMIV